MYDNGIAWMIGHASPTELELAHEMRERDQARALREARRAAGELGLVSRSGSAIRSLWSRLATAAGLRPDAATSACCAA